MVKNIFLSSCRRELQLSNCGFTHYPAEEFVKSQWQNRTKNIFYLLYRWAIAIFFIGAVGSSMSNLVTAHDWGYYFIYLTNWGILMCMITGIYGAILVSKWYFHTEYSEQIRTNQSSDMPISFKIYWIFHNVTLVIAISITVIYWSILHDNVFTPVNATNILTHACNSIIMFMDVLIVAYPIRLLHVVQPIIIGLIYGAFSFIYYLCSGLNKIGQPYIYGVLDWRHPENAILTLVGSMILAIFINIILFLVYKIRYFVYKKYCKNTEVNATKNNISNNFSGSPISMVFGNNYNNSNNNNNQCSAGSYTNETFKGSIDTF